MEGEDNRQQLCVGTSSRKKQQQPTKQTTQPKKTMSENQPATTSNDETDNAKVTKVTPAKDNSDGRGDLKNTSCLKTAENKNRLRR